jgi:hypothetical protein
LLPNVRELNAMADEASVSSLKMCKQLLQTVDTMKGDMKRMEQKIDALTKALTKGTGSAGGGQGGDVGAGATTSPPKKNATA